MNRDRGVIKWTSMMLPEHVQQLKEMTAKHKKKAPPQLDEQVLEEWSRLLGEAYYHDLALSITIIDHGKEETVQGFVYRIDQLQRSLTLELKDSRFQRRSIPFQDIIQISVDDEAV
ncbi:hypothetical protein J2S74_003595 [Evansella vedderi]|uniref:YolD-like protein n=1 Tax=Evansella vedderi TaxID=38282 RepID=A0ABT9ZY71_9BACI|nr:YolD-like family protein [Evansella vedderi]MDQ0256177.1 hypothetical protein [Evansella vedderi]